MDFMIGKGGMGEVWRARHKMLVRDAAMKLIRRRSEVEAQATASLRSPYTVALFDFGQTRDRSFY